MACEGKSLTTRDLAEIMAKTHHPEGQDAREVPVERESEGDGDSLGQSSERQQWLEVLWVPGYSYLIYAQLLLSMPSRFGVQFFRVCQESRFQLVKISLFGLHLK